MRANIYEAERAKDGAAQSYTCRGQDARNLSVGGDRARLKRREVPHYSEEQFTTLLYRWKKEYRMKAKDLERVSNSFMKKNWKKLKYMQKVLKHKNNVRRIFKKLGIFGKYIIKTRKKNKRYILQIKRKQKGPFSSKDISDLL